MARYAFYTETEFEQAFHAPASRFLSPGRSNGLTDPFEAAAHYIGGAFLDRGFRLFRNGGTPLLERREGPLVEEVVLQSRPCRPNEPVLMTARIHVSHEGLRDVRARYWTTPVRAPLVLASGNVSELEIPPGWTIWDVTIGGDTLPMLVEWLRELVVPWLELFEDPSELRRTLMDGDIPLLSRLNALEWFLAEFGRREAREYLSRLRVQGLLPLEPELTERLNSLTVCFHL